MRPVLKNHMQLTQCLHDECISRNNNAILLLYVDDMLVLGTPEEIKRIRRQLEKRFAITSMEINVTADFLGCQVTREESTGNFNIHQTRYIEKILKRFHKEQTHPRAKTPIPASIDWDTKQTATSRSYPFQEILGAVGYLRLTRPDLQCPIHILSRQMSGARSHSHSSKTSKYVGVYSSK